MPDEPSVNQWIASEDSASGAAAAFVRLNLVLPRFWVNVVGLCIAWFVGAGLALGRTPDTRMGVIAAVIVAFALIALLLVSSYRRMRKQFRVQMPAGSRFESEFFADRVALRGSTTDATVAFAGIESVKVVGNWVLYWPTATKLFVISPKALFPDADLARLRAHIKLRR